jgi:mannose-6-phosphate isomerase-like protein (cupin superfamily)
MTISVRRSCPRRGAVLALVLTLASACATRDAETVRREDSSRTSRDSAAADAVGADTGVAIGAASSAASSGVELYPAALLRQVGDSLARGRTSGHTLGSRGTYQYLQIRRASSGVPEVHDRWIDVTIVQAGRGTLLSGGQVTGSHVEAPGEHRGGTIVGGASRPVAAGDLMVIPAGVPHQFQITTGDSLRYLTTKVLDRATH